ncbi:MAG: hypothetical protein HON78_04145, partial [Legionellales bacterium]|nr:hypothetical protein [Legionellales bacterium]
MNRYLKTMTIATPSLLGISAIAILHIMIVPQIILACIALNLAIELVTLFADDKLNKGKDLLSPIYVTLIIGFTLLTPYVLAPTILIQLPFLAAFLALHAYAPHIIVGSILFLDSLIRAFSTPSIKSSSTTKQPDIENQSNIKELGPETLGNNKFSKQNDNLEEELFKLKASHAHAQAQVNELNAAQEKVDARVNELTAAKGQLEELTAANKTLTTDAQARVNELTAANDKLKTQVEELTAAKQQTETKL